MSLSPSATSTVVCKMLEETDLPAWDDFVAAHPQASVYHLSIWRHIFAQAFGKRWYLLAALQGNTIRAGLPLVHMKSRLFGNFLVSMPYVNYGGVLTEEDALAEPLLQHAVVLGQQRGAQYLELRHLEHRYPQLPTRQDKVSMWLTLPRTADALFAGFKAKLRSQIRKGEKNNLQVTVGAAELLEDFYTVFARNMRDLGTPVYGKALFRLILEAFPASARIVLVTSAAGIPVAGAFLLGYRERLEIPWASSLRKYNHLQSNMCLYWHCLQYACTQGYTIFDFGRSTRDESTFKFKEQWGAHPVPHYWHYHMDEGGALPGLSPHNPKFRLAIGFWRRLPVSLTRLLGPSIVKHLP